jgi:Flp pilus assembly protein TadB
MAEGDLLRAGRTLLGMGHKKDRTEGWRSTAAVVIALVWVGIGSAALHWPVVAVYALAVGLGFAVWFLSGALVRRLRSGIHRQPVDVDRVHHRDAG